MAISVESTSQTHVCPLFLSFFLCSAFDSDGFFLNQIRLHRRIVCVCFFFFDYLWVNSLIQGFFLQIGGTVLILLKTMTFLSSSNLHVYEFGWFVIQCLFTWQYYHMSVSEMFK